MAYTISHLYKKVLEATDKMGSDFYSVPYVMNRLETSTYDFIGETVKYIENTQEIRDDIRTLYKPFKLPVVNDGVYNLVALPDDYLHLMSAKVLDRDIAVRNTRIIRHGQENIFETDPNTKATAEYPSILLYSNTLKILSTGVPTYVQGYYIRKPIFGSYTPQDDLETEIAVNLPDNATDAIIKTIVRDIHINIGDPRAQINFVSEETFRKRGERQR